MSWEVSASTYGTYQYLLREVSIYMRWGANPDSLDPEQFGLLDSIVQRGVKRFYRAPPAPGTKYAHDWSFLRPTTTITTTAPYSTGTITVASGVVTLTSGVFPSTAAAGELTVSGTTYTVNTRDSDTQVTLDDTSVTVASAASYELVFPIADLPTDFADFEGPMTYVPGASALYGPIDLIPEYQIREKRQSYDYTDRPQCAAVWPKSLDPTTGTRYQIMFYPTPDGAYILTYRYRVNPGLLTTTNNYPYGTETHAETIFDAVLAEAEAYGGESREKQERFAMSLKASVDRDKRLNSPDYMGYNGDRSDGPTNFDEGVRYRTGRYNGVTTYGGSASYNGITY